MRSRILSLLLPIALLAAACTPRAAPTTTAAPARMLTVMAAAALTESFTELGKTFAAQNPGVTVAFNFAGSQQLAQQLDEGAAADVFASADTKDMDAAVTSQRVTQYDARTFVTDRLVVIFPKDNPAGVTALKDLAKPGLKLRLADQSVPAGQSAVDLLDKAVKDTEHYEAGFKDAVLANVDSYETDARAVVSQVALGEADAGIVYETDYNAAADRLGKLDIPDAVNAFTAYPIAVIADSQNADLARAFVDFVLSPASQDRMAQFGFAPAVSGSTSAGSYIVTDALGRAIRFEKAPQRIVLVGKALFMVADAIYLFPEAGTRIVALGSTQQGSGDFIPMIDATFADKTILDSSAGAEEIAAAQPDCVIMKSTNASSLGKALEAVKIPVVYLDFETPSQYQRDLKTLGQLFQNPDQAAKLADYFTRKAEAISNTVSHLTDEQKPRVLVLYYNEKDNTISFNVPPMTWMQSLMVDQAGGRPVWGDANPGSGWTKVGLEQIAAWNPDVIFITAYFNPVNEVVARLKADSQWQGLKAVKNNKLFGFGADVYSWDQPDTRWLLGLAWLAGKLHPDLFTGLDITKEAQTFYADLYGMDEASFQKMILPIMTGDIP